MKTNSRRISVLAMLSAVAYVVMFVGRVPVVLFLKYDPKDVIITIGGFLYGPQSAFAISAVVSFVEMFTVSDTGPIGLVMNIISSCSFACTAAFIYKRFRTQKGAACGLAAGWLFATVVMLLWNYLIAPLYMNVPRAEIAALLLPAFVPFNLLKGGLNAGLTMLLYKSVRKALSSARLTPPAESPGTTAKAGPGAAIASFFVIATCVLWALMLRGVI